MKINLLLFFAFFLCACNGQKVPQSESAKKFVAKLQAMNFDELKHQLKADTAELNQLIKTATFETQLTSHISPGQKSKAEKPVAEFSINTDTDKVAQLFNDYCKQLFFNQDFSDDAQTEFEFESRYNLTEDNHLLEQKDSLFKPYTSNIAIGEKAYYFNGKSIPKKQIGLKRVDSIEADISLKIPLEFEKFKFSKSDKNFVFRDENIIVERVKSNVAELKIPSILYSNIIGYQAFNAQNIRMNTSAFSSNPILEIKTGVKNGLNDLLDIFTNVLKEGDEKKAKEVLNNINQNHLDARTDMIEFKNFVTGLAQNKEQNQAMGDIDLYNKIAEIGRKVIEPAHQFVILEFPDDIKTIEIFVATKYRDLKNKKMVKFINHRLDRKFFDTANPNIVYKAFTAGEGRKYGISNQNGDKIIEARYEQLQQLSNTYFLIDEKLFWLNVNDKKMVSLKQFQGFDQTLKPGYDVFEKTVGDRTAYGVVLNRGKVILPFEYSRFQKYDKFIIPHKHNGEDELYDLNLKKLPNKGIKQLTAIDEFIASDLKYPKLFVAEDGNKKKALVNEDIQILTPFKYEFIDPFFEINGYYIAGIRTADGSNYLYGIIDNNGKEVVPFIFCNIDDEPDKNRKFSFCLEDKYQSMDFKLFLKKYGH